MTQNKNSSTQPTKTPSTPAGEASRKPKFGASEPKDGQRDVAKDPSPKPEEASSKPEVASLTLEQVSPK